MGCSYKTELIHVSCEYKLLLFRQFILIEWLSIIFLAKVLRLHVLFKSGCSRVYLNWQMIYCY